MSRITPVLCALYTVAAFGLVACALASSQHGQRLYTALFIGCAVLFAVAIGHHAYHRDELRAAQHQLESRARPPRPPQPRPGIDGAVAVAMARWCCDAWFLSQGRDHDPATCTRKDTAA